MMTVPTARETALGRLEKVDLRAVWQNEAGDFTPWLAGEENLRLLGDAIGLELELEGVERNVGPFRADLLCRDTGEDAEGHLVLIENQLERTDHVHLGQLLTYAAGLKAKTVVWVARRFTEEHRAALDWLNDITDPKFNFFGLEVELWRIGGSPVAPKFNVVCEPNDWTRTAGGTVRRVGGETNDTQQFYLEYWTALREYMLEAGGAVKPRKPQPMNWADFAVGRSGFYLLAAANAQQGRINCGLYMAKDLAKIHFHLLERDRAEIDAEMGEPLEWHELPNKKQSRIDLRDHEADPADRAAWPEQHAWLHEKLNLFHRVFGPRVRRLDAGDFEPDADGAG